MDFSNICSFIGGVFAGFIARGNINRGALAGFFAGTLGRVISAILLIAGMTSLWEFLFEVI